MPHLSATQRHNLSRDLRVLSASQISEILSVYAYPVGAAFKMLEEARAIISDDAEMQAFGERVLKELYAIGITRGTSGEAYR